MGSTRLMSDEFNYDPIEDIWTDSKGGIFIKNEFHPDIPIWIDISSSRWSVIYSGQIVFIDWDGIDLLGGIKLPIKTIVKDKLRKLCPTYMARVKDTLFSFQSATNGYWDDFNVSTSDFLAMWEKLHAPYRPYFRALYQEMANRKIGGVRPDLAYEIRKWVGRTNVVQLRSVLEWHETKGALTSSEEEVLRKTLSTSPPRFEPAKEQAIRIYGWLLLDTLKRSSQVLEISKNGLKCVPTNGRNEWFVEIRPIKYQTGEPSRWCHISEALANEINGFKLRRQVIDLHNNHDRLIVWTAPSLNNHGVLSAAEGKGSLQNYIYSRKAISPRTGKRLHVTPTRIRHTGATRLAFAGVSRDIIQEILEHDSPESCQAYIDAIGSDIVPQIEKAGRAMGNIFYELNKSFFQGKIVSEVTGAPIVVPEYCKTPLIVGSCGRDPIKDGGCKKHPFLSCYAGCSSFFAWDNPEPHEKALRYFETEKTRWNPTGESADSGSLSIPVRQSLAVFDKAIGSAKELLTQIRGTET